MSAGSTEPRLLFEAIDSALDLGLLTRTKQGMAREIVERAGLRWERTHESAGATVTLQGLLAVADAVEVLALAGRRRNLQVVSTATAVAPATVFSAYPEWGACAAIATSSELALIESVAYLATSGIEAPTVGYEFGDGFPLSVAWPTRRIAVHTDHLDSETLDTLRGAGWLIVEPTATAVRLALMH